jgi:hypothetical protein
MVEWVWLVGGMVLAFNQITPDENLSIWHFTDHAANGVALNRIRASAVVILSGAGAHRVFQI